ncbi:unnamed protein product [Pedinophyceae sp. YPF-701]|nr:unnamed protein product [Pedinophyceae sp. YPF-701]
MSDQPTPLTQKLLLERLRGLRRDPLGECSEQGCKQEAVFEKVSPLFGMAAPLERRTRCYCLRHGSWWMDEKARVLASGTWMDSARTDTAHHLLLLLGNHIRPCLPRFASREAATLPGTRYRPDLFFVGKERGVIVMCDRHGNFDHSGAVDDDRTVLTLAAAESLIGKPVHLIRFRPDEYEDENGVWGMHSSWVHRLHRLAVSVLFAMFRAEGPAQVDYDVRGDGRLTVERLFYGAYPCPPAELLRMVAPGMPQIHEYESEAEAEAEFRLRNSFKTTWQRIFEAIGGSQETCEALKDLALRGRTAHVPLPAAADDAACKDRRFQRLPRPYEGVGSPEPLAVPPWEQEHINANAQSSATKFGLGDVEHFDV